MRPGWILAVSVVSLAATLAGLAGLFAPATAGGSSGAPASVVVNATTGWSSSDGGVLILDVYAPPSVGNVTVLVDHLDGGIGLVVDRVASNVANGSRLVLVGLPVNTSFEVRVYPVYVQLPTIAPDSKLLDGARIPDVPDLLTLAAPLIPPRSANVLPVAPYPTTAAGATPSYLDATKDGLLFAGYDVPQGGSFVAVSKDGGHTFSAGEKIPGLSPDALGDGNASIALSESGPLVFIERSAADSARPPGPEGLDVFRFDPRNGTRYGDATLLVPHPVGSFDVATLASGDSVIAVSSPSQNQTQSDPGIDVDLAPVAGSTRPLSHISFLTDGDEPVAVATGPDGLVAIAASCVGVPTCGRENPGQTALFVSKNAGLTFGPPITLVNGSAIVESLEIDPAGVAHVGLTTPNGALYARVPPPYTTATVLRFPASGAAIVTDAFVASDANATWVVSRSLTLGFFGLYSNGPAYAYESFDGGRSFPRTYALRTVFGANLAPETLALFPDGRPVLAANVTYPDQTFAVSTVPIFDPSPSEGADLVQLGGAPALSSTGSAGNGPAFPGGSASGPGSTGGFGDTGQTGPSLGGPSGGTGNPGSGLPQVPVPQRILGTSGPALPLPFPSVPPVEAATGGVAALAIVGILFTDAGKLLLGGLFASMSTRLERAGVLSNEIRTAVFMEVARRPGVRFEELRRALGLSLGALSYHIGVLERERYIRSVRQWTHRRFFTMGSGMPVPAPATVIDRIGDILLATPGLTVAEVARRLGISRQLARYHLSALERRGFVRRIPGTAAVRYALTAKALKPAEPKPPGSPGGGQAAASVVASAGASAAGSHTEFVPLADPGVVPATTMPDPAGGRPQPPDEAGGSPGGYPQSP